MINGQNQWLKSTLNGPKYDPAGWLAAVFNVAPTVTLVGTPGAVSLNLFAGFLVKLFAVIVAGPVNDAEAGTVTVILRLSQPVRVVQTS